MREGIPPLCSRMEYSMLEIAIDPTGRGRGGIGEERKTRLFDGKRRAGGHQED